MKWRAVPLLREAKNLAVLALFIFGSCAALAETICTRGPQGPIQSCSRFGINFNPNGLCQRIDRSLASCNGHLFEFNPLTRSFRALSADLRPGRTGLIIGATSPDTIRQVLDHLERTVGSLSGFSQRLAQMILARHGRSPQGTLASQPASSQAPGSNPTGTSQSPNGPVTTTRPGDHGQGETATQNSGIAQRPTVDTTNLVGPDGKAMPSVCRDLHTSICNSSGRNLQRTQQQNKAFDTLRQFRNFFRIGFNQFLNSMQGILNTQPRKFAAFPNRGAQDTFDKLMAFLQGGLRKAVPTTEIVRQDLEAAIDGMDFPDPQAKQALKDKAKSINISFSPNLRSLDSIKQFIEGCGPDGMAPTAFALPASNTVIVCPGLLLGAVAKKQNLLDAVLHVVGHEMGHDLHIPFPGYFSKLEACFSEPPFNKLILPFQKEESIADTIGAAAVAQRCKQESSAECLQTLRTSLDILCFTTGQDRQGRPTEHPSGVFRINDIVGRNPDIMRALGCGQPTKDQPACLVQGKVPAQ